MIDDEGYRANVGLVIYNNKQQVLWGHRADFDAWQFPQGGLEPNESLEQAVYRELYEEVGLSAEHVQLVAQYPEWIKYQSSGVIRRSDEKTGFIGQKQKWFLLQLIANEQNICLTRATEPEFDDWRWVEIDYAIEHIVHFKQAVYQTIFKQFKPMITGV